MPSLTTTGPVLLSTGLRPGPVQSLAPYASGPVVVAVPGPPGTGVTYTAGNGLALAGSVFSVSPKSGGGLTVDGTGVGIDSSYSGLGKRYSVDVPSGSATAAITHGLGTLDVLVMVREISGGAFVEPDIAVTSATVVTLTFATAPTAGQYRVTVLA